MPWTGSRSREEWLAEVQWRGGRIRRRRRVRFGVVGALAMILPVSVTASALRHGPERAVELSAAGPEPVGDGATRPGPDAPTEPVPMEEPATTTTTAEVHQRVAVVNGSVSTTTPPSRSVPPADDPVVRSTTTTAPAAISSALAGSPPPPTTVPPAATATALAPCAVTDLTVTVSTDQSTYGPGGTVKGSAVLENRSGRTCLAPAWEFLEILNSAGVNVFSESAVTGFAGEPGNGDPNRKAEPGATYASTFYWAAAHCNDVPPVVVNETCAGRFPAGTYTVVARWDGGVSGRTTFRLSA